jgi:hypothetical protein
MQLISHISSGSPKNCQVGDAFKIEGVVKTVTHISKKYIYFDKGVHVHRKSFNYLVRQCKLLTLNNNLDVVNRELKDKLERSETYNQAQQRTINDYSKLSASCLDEIDELKKSANPSINLDQPMYLRYILAHHYEDNPYYKWLFAKRSCYHSDMDAEYEQKNPRRDYNVVGGGFYAFYTDNKVDTLVLYGESGTYGSVSKDHLIKAKPLLEEKYQVKVID